MPKLENWKYPSEAVKTHLMDLQGFFPRGINVCIYETVWPKIRNLLWTLAMILKFIYSEKATKFCEIFTLLLTVCTVVKSKVKISQNFVAFIWTLATYVHIYRFNFNFNSNLNLNFNFNFNFNFLLKIWIEFLEFPLG